MNPFAGFFKRGPDAIQLSDWLQNMSDSFADWGFKILSGDKSSQDMLVCFRLLTTTGSAYNLLHSVPSVASQIGTVYAELRAYFECLSHLDLLRRYELPQDRDKISKLHASVSLRLEETMTSLFSQNPNIKRCLDSAIGDPYSRVFQAAIKEYILAERRSTKHNTGNLLDDNVQALSSAVQRAAGLQERDRQSVVRIMSEDTEKALHLKFLTEFDFPNCKFLDFPDFFYQ